MERAVKNLGKLALRIVSVALVLGAGQSGQAASLRVSGTAGYLSEWEFAGDLTRKPALKDQEFSGTLTWKHVGLCTASGPQEKTGAIDLQISGAGASSRISAKLVLDGALCRYQGKASDSSQGVMDPGVMDPGFMDSGFMDCDNASGVPITLSFR
jgi:hypothetical protein